MREKEKTLKSQSAWLLFAKTVGFFFAFLLPFLVVRILTEEKVGVYRQVFLVISNVTTILPLGVSMSAYYYLSREPEKRASAIFNILIFNFFSGSLACAALIIFPQMLGNLFQNDEMTKLSPLIGITILSWIFSTFLETVAVANRESRLAVIFIISAQLTKAVLMSSAVIFFSTIEAFLYAAIFQGILQSIVLLIYLANRFPEFWTKFNPQFFREQLIYALPFGFAGILWIMQTDIHNYFVSHNFSAAEFAIYAFGCFQLPLLGMIHESVTSVLIPKITELQSKNDEREIIRLVTRAIQKLAFFYFPIYVFLVIVAQTFFVTLFTEKYAASVPIFLINITLLPFDIWVTDPIVRAYKSLGRFLLTLRIFIFIAMVSALYFMSQNLNLHGMIAVVVVTSLVERSIMLFMVAKQIGFKREDFGLLKNIWNVAASSLLAGLFLFAFYYYGKDFLLPILTDNFSNILSVFDWAKAGNFIGGSVFLGFCAVIFAFVYIPTANFFGLLEESEKEKVKSVWNRFIKRKSNSADAQPLSSNN